MFLQIGLISMYQVSRQDGSVFRGDINGVPPPASPHTQDMYHCRKTGPTDSVSRMEMAQASPVAAYAQTGQTYPVRRRASSWMPPGL
jgi:hypothetical protein